VLQIKWNEVRPCFLAAKTIDISATNQGDPILNGAGLDRFYTYDLLDSVQIPDFGGSDFHPYTYSQGDFRDTLIAYIEAANEPPVGWTLEFESLSPAIDTAPLPTPQRNPFDTGLGPTFKTYDTCYKYQIPTLTVSDQGSGDKVYLAFDLNIPGGFSQTGFIEFVKESLVTQAAWNATPRYYEMIFNFEHLTGL